MYCDNYVTGVNFRCRFFATVGKAFVGRHEKFIYHISNRGANPGPGTDANTYQSNSDEQTPAILCTGVSRHARLCFRMRHL
jgi:hypothetical protein